MCMLCHNLTPTSRWVCYASIADSLVESSTLRLVRKLSSARKQIGTRRNMHNQRRKCTCPGDELIHRSTQTTSSIWVQGIYRALAICGLTICKFTVVCKSMHTSQQLGAYISSSAPRVQISTPQDAHRYDKMCT